MDRDKLAKALAVAACGPEMAERRWPEWWPEADKYLAVAVDVRAEDEAWKVAQLAAPMLAAWGAAGSPIMAVRSAVALLAESRRQAGASAGGEGNGYG